MNHDISRIFQDPEGTQCGSVISADVAPLPHSPNTPGRQWSKKCVPVYHEDDSHLRKATGVKLEHRDIETSVI